MNNAASFLLVPNNPDQSIQISLKDATNRNSLSHDATCQVEIDRDLTKLYTRNREGNRKSRGGDEFYIRYEEICSAGSENDETADYVVVLGAVAIPVDNNDGSYNLHFSTTPMHPNADPACRPGDDLVQSVLTIYFEYSNGIGRLPPPTKRHWKNGGQSNRRYSVSGISRPAHIEEFQPPLCSMNLQAFDYVFCFGDSTMDQLVRQRPNKKGKYHFQSNIRVGEKLRIGLSKSTVSSMLSLLKDSFGQQLTSLPTCGHQVALIVGSCLWDILDADDEVQGQNYCDHLSACREYIGSLRDQYANVTIVWKSPMAVHVHVVDMNRLVEHDRRTATLFGINRVKYMSRSRSEFLHQQQSTLMEELGVPIMDLFDATCLSSDQLYPSDGRHYRPDLNRLMLSWFYHDASFTGYFTNPPFETPSALMRDEGCLR